MESIGLLPILRRWFWLIGLVVLATLTVLLGWVILLGPVHEATVTAQTPSPNEEDKVAFIETLKSDQVRKQTVSNLGLDGEAATYDLDVKSVPKSSLIYITIATNSPKRAAEIANEHVDAAIAHYDTMRIKPIRSEQELLVEEIGLAEEAAKAAEDALAQFQVEHGIAALQTKLSDFERNIAQLQFERDKRYVREAANVPDPIAEIDKLIAEREMELERLTRLAPIYNQLERKVDEAQAAHERVLREASKDPPPDLDQRLAAAEEESLAADKALADFRIQNGIALMERELLAAQKTLETLLAQRDELLADESISAADPTSISDELIAQRQQELEDLMALAPTYRVLDDNAKEMRQVYRELLSDYAKTELQVRALQTKGSIPVLEPARAGSQPERSLLRLLAIGLASSLAVGILLAFSLEYLFPSGQASGADSEGAGDDATLLGA